MPSGIAEIEFGKVAAQMLLFAVLINYLHAAFRDAVVAFNRVRGDFTAHLILGGVVYSLVARILATNFIVPRRSSVISMASHAMLVRTMGGSPGRTSQGESGV
jgi:hypothetical protein